MIHGDAVNTVWVQRSIQVTLFHQIEHKQEEGEGTYTVTPWYRCGIGSRTTHVYQNLPILKLHGQPGGTCVYEKPYIYAGFPSLNNVLSNSVQLKKKNSSIRGSVQFKCVVQGSTVHPDEAL